MADWRDWLRQAEEHFDRKEFDQAADLAGRVLLANPACAGAHQVVGLVNSEEGRPHDAIPRLTRALALQPDLLPAHNGLGRCYALLGELDQALHHLDIALLLQPDHAFAHFNRAVILLKLGRWREGWLVTGKGDSRPRSLARLLISCAVRKVNL